MNTSPTAARRRYRALVTRTDVVGPANQGVASGDLGLATVAATSGGGPRSDRVQRVTPLIVNQWVVGGSTLGLLLLLMLALLVFGAGREHS